MGNTPVNIPEIVASEETEMHEETTPLDELDPVKEIQWEETWAHLCAAYNQNGSDPNGETPGGAGSAPCDFGNLLTPTYEFQCEVCYSNVEPGDGVTLQTCFHSFCRACLVGTIEFSEGVVFQCPYQDGTESCPARIMDKEVKALCPEDVWEMILKRSITQAELNMTNSFHCCTVNCDGWTEVAEGAVAYNCVLCDKVNCIKCKAIHEAITCDEYQEKLKMSTEDLKTMETMENLVSQGKAMKCPQCGIWITKHHGCDYITCIACRTGICWATKGFRWGPKGCGDTTGGCRCRMNGALCSPKCKYCH